MSVYVLKWKEIDETQMGHLVGSKFVYLIGLNVKVIFERFLPFRKTPHSNEYKAR